jgi:hypothetical protein
MMNTSTVQIVIYSMINTVMCRYHGDNTATYIIVMSEQPAELYNVPRIYLIPSVLFNGRLMTAMTARTNQSLRYSGGESDLSAIKRD